MKKALLLIITVLFFTCCNNKREEKSDAERAIRDTFAQNVMQPFNTRPHAKNFHLEVNPREDNVLRAQQTAIRTLLADMKSQPQRFAIRSSEKNELQGEYGTRLSLDPNSFTSESGKEISSTINIELRECYSIDEMLQENLNTTSNNKVLESKGAVFVSATCNGEELKLKEGQTINIEFPFSGNHEYGFFYGDMKTGTCNWTPANPEEEVAAVASKPVLARPEFSYHGYTLNDYLISQLEYPDEAKRNELSANVEASFTVDKNGRIHDVTCASAYKTFREEIILTLQQMPKWKPATYGKKKINSLVKVNIDFNLRRKQQISVAFNSDDILPLITDHSAIGGDNAFASQVYAGSFDRLGWIGCSRLAGLGSEMADVVVRSDANTDVKIVLKDKTSIVSGENYIGYSRFKNLPVNTDVYVVAVRCEKGEMFYSVQPLKLEKQTVVSLNWKKGTEAEIEKMFRSIS